MMFSEKYIIELVHSINSDNRPFVADPFTWYTTDMLDSKGSTGTPFEIINCLCLSSPSVFFAFQYGDFVLRFTCDEYFLYTR